MAIPGKAIDKLSDYIQGRSERRRNNIESLEKEQDALKRKITKTVGDIKRLDAIATQLGKLYKNAANAA